MNCKKIAIGLYCMLLCIASAVSQEVVTRETNPGSKHYFEMCIGYPVKEGYVTVNDENFPAVFILDTGSYVSGYFCDNKSRAYDKIQNSGGVISAGFDDVRMDNIKKSAWLSVIGSPVRDKYSIDTVTVLLGTDVLIHKSLYLSITDGYFYWGKNQRNTEGAVEKELEPHFYGDGKYWYYYIYDDDEHFLTSENSKFKKNYLSSDGKQSKYLIDTASYFASTGEEDYFEIVERKGYENIEHYGLTKENKGCGICKVENLKFLGRKLDKAYYTHGFVIWKNKLYGTQVLGAFDIYFDCNEDGIAKTALFYPVEEEKYKAFVKKQDEIKLAATSFLYGFRTDRKNIVIFKAYLNGKDMAKKIEIGDEVLERKESEKSVEYKIKKQNGKIKKVKVKKTVL